MTFRLGDGSDMSAWLILGGKETDFPQCEESETVRKEVKKRGTRSEATEEFYLKRNLAVLDEFYFGNSDEESIGKQFRITKTVVRNILGLIKPERSRQIMEDLLTNNYSKSDVAIKYKINPVSVEEVIKNHRLKKLWLETIAKRRQIWIMSQNGFNVY
jgi:hypothetical protein